MDTFREKIEAATTPERLPDVLRGLLGALTQVTDMDCAYLTRVDRQRTTQWVVVSQQRDHDGVVMPAGTSTPWDASLCRHAMADGVPATDAADRRWPDAQTVRDQGVRTFVSQPVMDDAGVLRGTLCVASRRAMPEFMETLRLAGLIARVIELRIEFESKVELARATFEQRRAAVLAPLSNATAHQQFAGMQALTQAFAKLGIPKSDEPTLGDADGGAPP